MADEPESTLLQYMRRFDAKLDRVVDEMLDVKVRLTAVEEGLAGVNRRLDRLEIRVERIERRLDLVDQPH
jgi:archaellum component FlaC